MRIDKSLFLTEIFDFKCRHHNQRQQYQHKIKEYARIDPAGGDQHPARHIWRKVHCSAEKLDYLKLQRGNTGDDRQKKFDIFIDFERQYPMKYHRQRSNKSKHQHPHKILPGKLPGAAVKLKITYNISCLQNIANI